MTFTQPARRGSDGPVNVQWTPDGRILVAVETNLVIESITMNPHNASRVWALLALLLKIPVAASVQKAIKF